MTGSERRRFVVSALEQANVLAIRTHPARAAFLDGAADIEFSDLAMDSLARMELCIFIEVNARIEITPDQLNGISSLAGLEKMLAGR